MDRRETNKSPGTEEDETLQPGSRDDYSYFKRKCKSGPADTGLVYQVALPNDLLGSNSDLQ